MPNWAKIKRNLPRAPIALAEAAMTRMKMGYYRNIAEIGDRSRVLNDGLIINPSGDRARVRLGSGTLIRGELFVQAPRGRLSIGNDCFVGPQSYIWAWDDLTIGDKVLISHHVNIHDTDSHSFDPLLRDQHFQAIRDTGHPWYVPDVKTARITIGDHAWIGYGASILKGVNIGEGACVAFRAVVTKDVPPWTVVAGFPARPMRDLAKAEQIQGSVKAVIEADRDRLAHQNGAH